MIDLASRTRDICRGHRDDEIVVHRLATRRVACEASTRLATFVCRRPSARHPTIDTSLSVDSRIDLRIRPPVLGADPRARLATGRSDLLVHDLRRNRWIAAAPAIADVPAPARRRAAPANRTLRVPAPPIRPRAASHAAPARACAPAPDRATGNTLAVVRVGTRPRAIPAPGAFGTLGRLAMLLTRATPLPRSARIGLTLVTLGLLACSRATTEPQVADPRPAPLVAAATPAPAPAPAPAGPEAPVPEDMPKETAGPIATRPLDPQQQAAFAAPREDEPAAELGGVTEERKGQHYVTGNERTLEAFYPRIRELGGAYVGVGSDQAYLLLAWQRAELVWLVDYDPVVVDLHAVYHALFAVATTPEQFLALWQKDSKDQAIAALHAAYPGEPGARREALYRRYRARIAKRLGQLQQTMTAAAVPTFLTDAGEYSYVRDLIQAGRVRALLADLSRDGAIRQIGAAARALNTPVRVVYLSNAEEYWERLPQPFRDNLAALHVDERSVVLRTLLSWQANQDYRYNAQPVQNYQQWLASPAVRSIYDVVRRKSTINPGINFFETTELPDDEAVRKRQERRDRLNALARAQQAAAAASQ